MAAVQVVDGKNIYMTISIIGGGRIGSAIAHTLKETVLITDIDPHKSNTTKSRKEVIADADVIFVCTPTETVEMVCKEILKINKKGSSVVFLSKGVNKKGETVFEIAEKILKKRVVMMCGPMMAEDILENGHAFAVCAGVEKKVVSKVVTLFQGTKIHCVGSEDPRGLSLLSVAKNVYATLSGVGDGLHTGANVRGVIVKGALREMEILMKLGKGKLETVYSYAGIADLVCTVTSPHSRNRSYGESLVTHETSMMGEGAKAITALHKRFYKHIKKLPLLQATYEIIKDTKNAAKILDTIE